MKETQLEQQDIEEQDQEIDKYPVQFSPADQYLSLFGTDTFWLMVFVENIIQRNSKENLPPILYNTLLEAYLDLVSFEIFLITFFLDLS